MSIISLSGKANSGKDLIAKIIQGLTINPNADIDYIEKFYMNSKFVNKKWADKLKDIVCLLTGCTRVQLEDRNFKESELGEEWWQWKVINHDPDEYNCTIFSSEKEANKSILVDGKYWWYYNPTIELFKPTYRYLLQHIGTDLFRNQLHPQIWVNVLMSEYRREGGYEGGEKTASDGGYYSAPSYKGEYPSWIISDTRFPNEFRAVKDKGGLTINVIRHNHPNDINPETEHISETALDSAEFDEVIINNGSIEELIDKVKVILIKYKII